MEKPITDLQQLRTLPLAEAELLYRKTLRDEWQKGFGSANKITTAAIEIFDKDKSVAQLQREASAAGYSNLPHGFNEE